MNKLLFALLILLTQNGFCESLYKQLKSFNPNWEYYESFLPKQDELYYYSDRNLVETHLFYVLKVLRSNTTDHLNYSQLIMRKQLINELDSYRKAGRFPLNYYKKKTVPVFIDKHNTHCAVGFLMKSSGFGTLAREISTSQNYAWVKEIRHPELPTWQQKSGFTWEELKLIQGVYDVYFPNAHLQPNAFEIPQKPEVVVRYFDEKKKQHIWSRGYGVDGVLNGTWEQNYAKGIPWIKGSFKNGKCHGKWSEYYQGTKQLCRTEIWKNDKLHGLRKRFDRSGNLIQEIVFKNGVAVSKTNYEIEDETIWMRTPIDSNYLFTTVFDNDGAVLAYGKERIENKGKLQWFQNIELTALNSAALGASNYYVSNLNNSGVSRAKPVGLEAFHSFQRPELVNYIKQGDWVYYDTDFMLDVLSEDIPQKAVFNSVTKLNVFHSYLSHLGLDRNKLEKIQLDSSIITFNSSLPNELVLVSKDVFYNLELEYHTTASISLLNRSYGYSRYNHNDYSVEKFIKQIKRYNKEKQRIGSWKYFNDKGKLTKTEEYLVPEDEVVEGRGSKGSSGFSFLNWKRVVMEK